MKTITPIAEGIFHVISEPGDATRYDYFVYHEFDNFCFMPKESTFRFPQRLNYWAVHDLDEEAIDSLSKKESCNPYTLRECIRTIKELWRG